MQPENGIKIGNEQTRKYIIRRGIGCFIDVLFFLLLMEVLFPAVPKSGLQIYFKNFILMIIWFGYFILLEYYFQKTPGKYIIKLQVADENGALPSFIQIMKRNVAKLIPLEYVSYRNQTWWHDRWSGTVALNDSK